MNQDDLNRIAQGVVARAQQDEGFRQRLLDAPRETLAEAGVAVPDGVEVRFRECVDGAAGQASGRLSDADLDQVSAGATYIDVRFDTGGSDGGIVIFQSPAGGSPSAWELAWRTSGRGDSVIDWNVQYDFSPSPSGSGASHPTYILQQ